MPESLNELIRMVVRQREEWGYRGAADRYRIRVECAKAWAGLTLKTTAKQ